MSQRRNLSTDNEFDLSGLENYSVADLPDITHTSRFVTPSNNAGDIAKILKYMEILRSDLKHAGFRRWFVPGTPFGIEMLPKHRAFLFAGKDYRQRYFSAANRVGKTICGAFETSLHCTGQYPDWWEGKRFDGPVEWLVAGKSSETTRDIIQKELLGTQGSYGTGMIPKDCIIETRARPGVAGAVGLINVRHVSGGTSEILVRSYDQGREAFEGIKRHGAWCDELPDATIYSEIFMRTMSYKGITFITATAKQGLTPLVLSFYNGSDWLPVGQELPTIVKLVREQREMGIEQASKDDDGEKKPEEFEKTSKAVIVAGWNDAPWLSEEDKRAQIAEVPPHLISATSTGLPGIGSGSVFTTPLEDIVIRDFPIPAHYRHICGMDVGWNFTGAVHVVENPEDGQCYVVSEYKRGQAEPMVHARAVKNWGEWIPVEIDPASKARGQHDGKQLFNLYRKEGLRLIEANNAVEAGIQTLYQMFSTGQLKIFTSCLELQKEIVTYARDEHGKIVKKNDHVVDALRYAIMGLAHARVKPSSKKNLKGVASGSRYDI